MEVRRDPVAGWHRQLDSERPRLAWVTTNNGHPRALREDAGRQSPVQRVRLRCGRGLGVKWRRDHEHEARREREDAHMTSEGSWLVSTRWRRGPEVGRAALPSDYRRAGAWATESRSSTTFAATASTAEAPTARKRTTPP